MTTSTHEGIVPPAQQLWQAGLLNARAAAQQKVIQIEEMRPPTRSPQGAYYRRSPVVIPVISLLPNPPLRRSPLSA